MIAASPDVPVRRRCACALLCTMRAHGADRSADSRVVHRRRSEHFKYGSIGTEERVGVPYRSGACCRSVFADKLPERPGTGYERLGFIYEPARRPIGTSAPPSGRVARVGLNCATCHAGTIRDVSDEPARRSCSACRPPDGSPGLRALPDRVRQRSALHRRHADRRDPQGRTRSSAGSTGLIYRCFVDRRTRKKGILERLATNAWFDKRPPARARAASTRSTPTSVLLGFDMTADDTRRHRRLAVAVEPAHARGMWLHWDGNNDRVEERNKSAAIGAGATPDSLDLASLDAHRRLDPGPQAAAVSRPAASIGEGRAGRRPYYQTACASCHRSRARAGRAGRRHRRDRHRSGAPELVHAGAGRADEHDRRGQAVAVHALPQDQRLRQHAARRRVAARAVSAQRIGADAARAAVSRGAPGGVLPRLRRLRLGQRSASSSTGAEAEKNGVRFDTTLKRQQQRRPSVRHESTGRRPRGHHRVPEDALTRCSFPGASSINASALGRDPGTRRERAA